MRCNYLEYPNIEGKYLFATRIKGYITARVRSPIKEPPRLLPARNGRMARMMDEMFWLKPIISMAPITSVEMTPFILRMAGVKRIEI